MGRYRASSLARELAPGEVAAMWLYGAEYAASGLSAVDWYAQLSDGRRNVVTLFVDSMREAFKHPITA
jgi:hypothetical protein